MTRLRWLLEVALFIGISLAIAIIPHGMALRFGRLLGKVFFRLLHKRRRIAIDNISAALPFLERQPGWDPSHGTAEEIARKTFENLGMSVVETCRVYHGFGRGILDAIEFRGAEHFENARARQRGVLLIGAHSGNWELGVLALGRRFHDLSGVAKRQKNIYMNRVIEKIRIKFGNRIIYSKGALKAMLVEFRKHHTVGVLIDQASSPAEGLLLGFLGRSAWTISMPVIIARKTGVPMVPAFMHREAGRHVITISPEIVPTGADDDGRSDMVRLNAALEDFIVQHPTEWYWIHNRWKRAGEPMAQKGDGQ